MAALDFPSSPTVGQQYNGTNGAVYTWDGAVWNLSGTVAAQPAGGDLQGTYPNPTIKPTALPWSVSGATLTPTDSTKNVTLVGTGSMTTVTLGTGTAKGRLQTANTAAGAVGILSNRDWTTNAQDDGMKPSWALLLNPATDALAVQRSPAGSTTQAGLLTLDSTGGLTIAGALLAGPGTVKGSVVAPDPSSARFTANDPWAPQDSTRNSWGIFAALSTSGGQEFNVYYRAPGAGAGTVSNPFKLDNAGNITILGGSAVKASGTTWANPSDRRIKKNIAPYTQGLDAILALKPSTFEFNGLGGSQDGLAGIGLIADEVQPVMPEMVSVTPTKLKADDETPVDLLTLDTSALQLALVNAVKELAGRVATLEAR